MTSKWIEYLKTRVRTDDRFDEPYIYLGDLLPTIDRIDKLLRRAMAETDSETLLDAIEHEIINEKKVTGASKPTSISGVSNMYGLSEDEVKEIIDQDGK